MAVWLLVVVWRRAGAGTGPGPEAEQHVSKALPNSVIILMVFYYSALVLLAGLDAPSVQARRAVGADHVWLTIFRSAKRVLPELAVVQVTTVRCDNRKSGSCGNGLSLPDRAWCSLFASEGAAWQDLILLPGVDCHRQYCWAAATWLDSLVRVCL